MKNRHFLLICSSIALLNLGFSPSAHAFGTIRAAGQNAEHEKITREGLKGIGIQPWTMDMLAGKNGTFGAVGAPDNPGRGLLLSQRAHCDNGDHSPKAGYPRTKAEAQANLAECRFYIAENLNRALGVAQRLIDANGNIQSSEIPDSIPCHFNGHSGRAKCDVLEALGMAFHASQDFYSHSNWSDATGGSDDVENFYGLGNREIAPYIQAEGIGLALPDTLITGCFKLVPESAWCNGHVKHEFLNKDKGSIENGVPGLGTTQRGEKNDNFKNAALLAMADTRAKWVWFENRILAKHGQKNGTAILCAIKQDGTNNAIQCSKTY